MIPHAGRRRAPQRSRFAPHLRLGVSGALYVILAPMDTRQETTRYDAGARRRSHRKTPRETGVWVYIPAAELRAIGRDPHSDPPTYRIFAMSRNSVALRFYD